MMVGGLFASLGMILASFSTSIMHIYLSVGVITGTVINRGMNMMYNIKIYIVYLSIYLFLSL